MPSAYADELAITVCVFLQPIDWADVAKKEGNFDSELQGVIKFAVKHVATVSNSSVP